jgi:hypothetical protein
LHWLFLSYLYLLSVDRALALDLEPFVDACLVKDMSTLGKHPDDFTCLETLKAEGTFPVTSLKLLFKIMRC